MIEQNTIQEIIDSTVADTKSAIKEFGEYYFFDTRAWESVDTKSIAQRFVGLSASEIEAAYKGIIYRLGEEEGEHLLESVTDELENILDSDVFNELLDNYEDIPSA